MSNYENNKDYQNRVGDERADTGGTDLFKSRRRRRGRWSAKQASEYYRIYDEVFNRRIND